MTLRAAPLTEPWRHEDQREDIERFAAEHSIAFDTVWRMIHTPIDELDPEQLTLMSALFAWTLHDNGLTDKVTVSISAGENHEPR